MVLTNIMTQMKTAHQEASMVEIRSENSYSMRESFNMRSSRKSGMGGSSQGDEDELNSSFVQKMENNTKMPQELTEFLYEEEDLKKEEYEEYDVYPLSINYSKSQRRQMRFWWISFLIIIVVVLTPNDVIIPFQRPFRTGFWANKITTHEVSLSGLSTLTLKLQNCDVRLYSSQSKTAIKMVVSAGYDIDRTLQSNKLTVTNTDEDEMAAVRCYIDFHLPVGATGVTLPAIVIQTEGSNNRKTRLYEKLDPGDYLNFGTNSVTVSGNLMNVYLHQPHVMDSLSINLKIGQIELSNFAPTTSASVIVTQGVINIVPKSTLASVSLTSIKETNGQICLSGGAVNSVTATNCPNTATRATDIAYNNGVVDATTQCDVGATICNNATCTGSGSFTLTVKTDDGAVQVKTVSGSSTVSYQRSTVQTTVNSETNMKSAQTDVQSNPEFEWAYFMDVFAPGYQEVWLFSNRRVFLYFSPWVMSATTLGLLKPWMKRSSIYLIDSACTMTDRNNLEQNLKLSQKINAYFTQDANSGLIHVVLKPGQTVFEYREYLRNEQGQVTYVDLDISLVWQYAILLYLAMALGWVGSVIIFIVVYKAFKAMDIQYGIYLQKQRSFALAKKYENDVKKNKGQVMSKSMATTDKQIIFKMGLFTYKIVSYPLSKKVKLSQTSLSRFGIFQTMYILFDFYRRRRQSSLINFLDVIPPSVIHFPRTEYQKMSNKFKTTLKIKEFQQKYEEFCIKYGYVPEMIEENKEKLAEYGIEIKFVMDASTRAYYFIRWKRDSEKEDIEQDLEMFQNENPITLFLRRECQNTSFKSDYLTEQELMRRYNKFCFDMGIKESQIDQIVGSQEMIDFGAEHTDTLSIPVLDNITKGDLKTLKEHQGNTSEKYSFFETGFVRKRQMKDVKKRTLWFWRKMKQFWRYLWKPEGPLTCLCQVLIFYILLLFISADIVIYTAFMWSEETMIRPNVYATYFQFENQWQPDSYNWLYHHARQNAVLLAFYIEFFVFYSICLLELLSYFCNGFLNNGKYQLKRTFCKVTLTRIFWAMLILHVLLLGTLIINWLVWYILAAIINPAYYLPYAATSITVIAFLYYKTKQVKQIEKDLIRAVSEVVEDEINSQLKNSIELITGIKKEELQGDLFSGEMEKGAKEQFIRSLIGFLGINANNIDSELLQKMVSGDEDAYVQMISDAIGIHPSITRTIISILKMNNEQVLGNIESLAGEYGIDPSISKVLSEICLEKYNPDLFGIRTPDGSTILSVKKLLRLLFPQFEQELVEGIFSIISEGDPRLFIDKIDAINDKQIVGEDGDEPSKLIPTQMFTLLKSFLFENTSKMNNSIEELGKVFLHGHERIQQLFETLYNLSRGDIKTAAAQLAELSEVNPKFLIPCIISFTSENTDLARDLMIDVLSDVETMRRQLSSGKGQKTKDREEEKSVSQIENEVDGVMEGSLNDSKQEEGMLQGIEDMIDGAKVDDGLLNKVLSLININRGSTVNVGNITKSVGGEYNKDTLVKLQKISTGSMNDFTFLIDKLMIFHSKTVLQELYRFIIGQEDQLPELCKALDIDKDMESALPALINMFQVGLEAHSQSYEDSILIENMEDSALVLSEKGILSDKRLQIQFRNSHNKVNPIILQELSKLKEEDYKYLVDLYDTKLLDKLTIHQINSIKSFGVVIYCMRVDIQATDEAYDRTIRLASEVLQISKVNLHVILDIISGNPLKIFQSSTGINEIIKGSPPRFNNHRLVKLKEILKADNTKTVEKIGMKWVDAYILARRGNNEVDELTLQVLKLPKSYIKMLRDVQLKYKYPTIKENKYAQIKIIEQFFLQFDQEWESITEQQFKSSHDMEVVDQDPRFKVDQSIIKSPFRGIDNLCKQGLVQVIQSLVRLKVGDQDMFKQLGIKSPQMFSHIISYFRTKSTTDFLHIMLQLTQTIKLKSGIISRSEAELEQYQMIQMTLLGCCKHLNYQSKSSKAKLDQSVVTDMISLANRAISRFSRKKFPKVYFQGKLDQSQFIESLFEMGYFNKIAVDLIEHQLQPIFKTEIRKPESLLGMLLGLSLDNTQLLRSSLIEFIGDEIKPEIINGVFGILMNDLSAEIEIKKLAKKIGLNPKLLVKLLDLTNENCQSVKSAVKVLTNDLCEKQKIITGLISLLKGDISQVKHIASILSLDTDLLNSIMSLANGNIENAKSHFQHFSKVFGMGGSANVETILRICTGETEAVYDLANICTGQLKLPKPELAEAFLFLTHTGIQIMNYPRKSSQTKQNLAKLEITTQILMKQLNNSISAQCSAKYGNQSIRIGEFVKVLISSIWGEPESLKLLLEQILASNHKVNQVWRSEIGKTKRAEIFQTKVRALFQVNQLVEQMISSHTEERVKMYRDVHQAIVSGGPDAFKQLNQEQQDFVDSLDYQAIDGLSNYENYLYNVGCTFNITSEGIKQKYYNCLTCSSDLTINICEVCAQFCHKDHQLEEGNFGEEAKVSCDCGNGMFSNDQSGQLNSNNPIKDKVGHMNPNECCMKGIDSAQVDSFWDQAVKQVMQQDQMMNQQESNNKKKDKDDLGDDDKGFKSQLANYSVIDFIYDMEMLFRIDEKQSGKRIIYSEYLTKSDFDLSDMVNDKQREQEVVYIFDHRQKRAVTFFENIMYLAMGMGKASFVTLFASGRQFTEDDAKAADFKQSPVYFQMMDNYAATMTIMGLVQGDSANLQMYGASMCEDLGIEGSKEHSKQEKLYSMHLLTRGAGLNEQIEKVPEGSYEFTIHLLFENHFKKALLLHKLISSPDKEITSVMALTEEQREDEKYQSLNITCAHLIDQLFMTYFQMDSNSIKWGKALLRICLRDLDGFDMISKDLKVNNTKAVLYKSFASTELSYVNNVLNALSNAIPIQFAEMVYQIGQGDHKALINLIITKFLLQMDTKMTWENIKYNKISSYNRAKVYRYLTALIQFIQCNELNLESNLRTILKQLKWNKNFTYAVKTMSGILKDDYRAIDELDRINKDKNQVAHEVLAIFTNYWDRRNVAKITRRVIDQSGIQGNVKEYLITCFEPDKYGRGERELGIKFVSDLFLGLEGNVVKIANVLDAVAFQNESCVFTLMANFNYGGSLINEVPPDQHDLIDALRTMYKKDIYKIILRLLSMGDKEVITKEFLDFLFSKCIPELLVMASALSQQFIQSIFDPVKLIPEVDSHFLITLINMVKPNIQIPDLKPIFDIVLNLDSTIISIPNFPSLFNIDLGAAKGYLEDHALKMNINIGDFYDGLGEEFCRQIKFKVTAEGIDIDIVKGFKILFDCNIGQKQTVLTLVKTFMPLFRGIELYPHLLRAFVLLVEKRKAEVFQYLPHIILMTLATQVGKLGKAISEAEANMVKALVLCFDVIMRVLRKDKISNPQESLSTTIEDMLTLIQEEGRSALKLDADLIHKTSVILTGFISMCRQDFQSIGQMATQIGGFSDSKIGELIQFIRKFLKIFNQFDSSNLIESAGALTNQMIGNMINDGLDANKLFNMFDKDGSGTIDFDEFVELCKYLGVTLGEQKMLKLFSSADSNMNNSIGFDEFTKAMIILRAEIAREALERLGVSRLDLLVFFIISLLYLIALLCFILLGVKSFSVTKDFDSIINSMLPMGAGLIAGRYKIDVEKVKNQIKSTVHAILDQMKGIL